MNSTDSAEQSELRKANERIDELDDIIDDLGSFVDEAFSLAIWMHGEELEDRLTEIIGRSWRILSEQYFESMLRRLYEEDHGDAEVIKEQEEAIDLAKNIWMEKKIPDFEAEPIVKARRQQRSDDLLAKDKTSLTVLREKQRHPSNSRELQHVIDGELRRIMWDYKGFPSDRIRPVLEDFFGICAQTVSETFIDASRKRMMDGIFEGGAIMAVSRQYEIAVEIWRARLRNSQKDEG